MLTTDDINQALRMKNVQVHCMYCSLNTSHSITADLLFMHITCSDVAAASDGFLPDSIVLLQPLYGFAGKDPARFARAAGHQDLLYVHDPEMTFEQVRLYFILHCMTIHGITG